MELHRNEFVEAVVDMGDYFKIATRTAELPVRKTHGLCIRAGDGICYVFDDDDCTIGEEVALSRNGKQYAMAYLYF